MTKRNKPMQWMLLTFALAAIISGCGKEESAGTPPQQAAPPAAEAPAGAAPPQTAQPGQPAQGGAAQPEKPKPAAPVKLSPIPYSDADKQLIKQTAKIVEIQTVYLPQQGAQDDRMDQVGSTAEGHLEIRYVKMLVTLSNKKFAAGQAQSEKPVQLKNGPATWVTVNGQPSLHLKQGDMYIAISSAKAVSPEEIQAIAETLAPMQ